MAKSSDAKRNQLSAQDWLLAAIAAMAKGGVENVKVERLAKSLGTSKGSFYWHFKDRKDLLDQLIRYWVTQGTEQVMATNLSAKTTARERLRALFNVALKEPVGTLSSAQGEMAIRSWAAVDPNITKSVSATDEQRIAYVTALFAEFGHPKEVAATNAQQLYLMLLGFYARATYAPHEAKAAQESVLAALNTMLQTNLN
ncbi:TetR family transcriptional regulator [Maritalea mobilis]|uniref:TetR family transcriptional regulator n=1 Tax=Maritalea mobilis TaxID=483324 RepID=A0A4R6VQD7_9HYPH|nr:TetR/AcrR family transcriptional regulator [Maritalea mobilis]TDQ64512.1 TetR family transcriptional regulator [Maritalea mobilis]